MMTKLILPALLLIASSPFPALAQGQQGEVHVAYRDLDLATPTGLAELDRRIARGIKAVCPQDHSVELSRQAIVKQCHRVIAAAVASQRLKAIASMTNAKSALAAR